MEGLSAQPALLEEAELTTHIPRKVPAHVGGPVRHGEVCTGVPQMRQVTGCDRPQADPEPTLAAVVAAVVVAAVVVDVGGGGGVGGGSVGRLVAMTAVGVVVWRWWRGVAVVAVVSWLSGGGGGRGVRALVGSWWRGGGWWRWWS